METVLRLIEENKLHTHNKHGGVYCLVNDEVDLVLGSGKDEGREFYLYVEMLVIDKAHLREQGSVFLRDKNDWNEMRAITTDDDVRFIGKLDPLNDTSNH